MAREDEDGKAGQDRGAQQVGADHDQAAWPAVDQGAGGQAGDEPGKVEGRSDRGDGQGIAGQRGRQQWCRGQECAVTGDGDTGGEEQGRHPVRGLGGGLDPCRCRLIAGLGGQLSIRSGVNSPLRRPSRKAAQAEGRKVRMGPVPLFFVSRTPINGVSSATSTQPLSPLTVLLRQRAWWKVTSATKSSKGVVRESLTDYGEGLLPNPTAAGSRKTFWLDIGHRRSCKDRRVWVTVLLAGPLF